MMYQNQVGQAEASFNHFYSDHMQPPYHPNPAPHGRHTPHVPQPPNYFVHPPQPGQPGGPPIAPTWNGGFNTILQHQLPQQPTFNPLPTIHPNHPGHPNNFVLTPANRHQFGPHHTPLGNPFHQPPIYGHQPTSQFVMPVHQFQGGAEIFHQGYVTAGGPFSAHHHEVFYPMTEQRQIPTFMAPSQPQFNHRHTVPAPHGFSPLPPKQDALSSSFVDVCGQYGIEIPLCRKSYCEQIREFQPVFPDDDDIDLSHIVFKPVQDSQGNQMHVTNMIKDCYTKDQSRMNTPSDCILERNTCNKFDESSEELAEIFSRKQGSNWVDNRESSDAGLIQTRSSDCIYYSEEENYDNTPYETYATTIEVQATTPSIPKDHVPNTDYVAPINNTSSMCSPGTIDKVLTKDHSITINDSPKMDNIPTSSQSTTVDHFQIIHNVPTIGYSTTVDDSLTICPSTTLDNVPTSSQFTTEWHPPTIDNVQAMGSCTSMEKNPATSPSTTMDNGPTMSSSTTMDNVSTTDTLESESLSNTYEDAKNTSIDNEPCIDDSEKIRHYTVEHIQPMDHSTAMENIPAVDNPITADNSPDMGNSTAKAPTMKVNAHESVKNPQVSQMAERGDSQQGCGNKRQEPQTPLRPPPGFAYRQNTGLSADGKLHKVGHHIKGLLKRDTNASAYSHHEGSTIRSMIQQPIYSNCASRLKIQECGLQPNKARKSKSTSVLKNAVKTGQTRYTQKITSHFRLLFEPIPDMFGDSLMSM